MGVCEPVSFWSGEKEGKHWCRDSGSSLGERLSDRGSDVDCQGRSWTVVVMSTPGPLLFHCSYAASFAQPVRPA